MRHRLTSMYHLWSHPVKCALESELQSFPANQLFQTAMSSLVWHPRLVPGGHKDFYGSRRGLGHLPFFPSPFYFLPPSYSNVQARGSFSFYSSGLCPPSTEIPVHAWLPQWKAYFHCTRTNSMTCFPQLWFHSCQRQK